MPADSGSGGETGPKVGGKSLQLPDNADEAQHDNAAVSEISFFYEDGEEEDDDENDETADAPFILLQGACRIGKAVN